MSDRLAKLVITVVLLIFVGAIAWTGFATGRTYERANGNGLYQINGTTEILRDRNGQYYRFKEVDRNVTYDEKKP